ncbi:MAG: hypothetical protein O3A00_20705 [Planctomycetota bacterium]|nr:hypothetical protein [Planctomycetota bacterium]
MKSFCLLVARFALPAWFGAATLFVITSVREQVSQAFDFATKDQLALVRFPAYYWFGFVLVGVSLACLVAARSHSAVSTRRMRWSVGLVIASLCLMVVDYFYIYEPLAALIHPVGQERVGQFLADFTAYHNASKYINFLDGCLCMAAGLLISTPRTNP